MKELTKEKEYWQQSLSSRLDNTSFNLLARMITENVPQHAKGIELGCGEGRLLSLMPNVTGIDFSPLGIMHGADSQKKMICADATKLPFPSGSFDFVVTNSLHHMPYKGVLPEIHRVLKKNGKLILFEPNRWHIYNLLFSNQYGIEIVGDRGFFPGKLISYCKDAGFFADKYRFIILNMERIRFLTVIQRVAQLFPTRFFQAWFYIIATKHEDLPD